MQALGEATGHLPSDKPRTHTDEEQQPTTWQPLDSLPDETQVGFTDTMFLQAGLGISRAGLALGLEAPTTLDQVHRRGEVLLLASLGAAAIINAAETTRHLL